MDLYFIYSSVVSFFYRSNPLKCPSVTVASSLGLMKSNFRNPLIIPGPSAKESMITTPSLKVFHNFFEAGSGFQGTKAGSFPDSSPPISLRLDSSVFPDNDESFLRVVDSSALMSYINIANAKGLFKRCPGGRQGGGASGGAYHNSGGSSYGVSQSSGSSWVTGGSSGGVGGAGGGSGDDDPSKRPHRDTNSGPAPVFIDDEQFNSFDYLGDAFEDLLGEDLFRDVDFPTLVMSAPQFGFNHRDPSYSYPTDPSVPSDPASTPAAPLTPGPTTPGSIGGPTTPGHMGGPMTPIPVGVGNSPQGPVQPVDTSGMMELLEISKLMVAPQPAKMSSYLSQNNSLVHSVHPPNHTRQQQPISLQQQQLQQPIAEVPTSSAAKTDLIDFLDAKMTTDNSQHTIELFVPFDAPQDKKDIGFRALQHNYQVYLQYQDALKNASLVEIQVANQQTAKLCSMELGMSGQPKLCFKMPRTC